MQNATNKIEEMDIAERLEEIVKDCLYRPEELTDEQTEKRQPPEGAILQRGIIHTFVFHPERLKSHRAEIAAILGQMQGAFFQTVGGGASFLNLCVDKNGHQWGEHRNCELLCVLAIACGLGRWTVPQSMWTSLPGGMPYVSFDLSEDADDLKGHNHD